MGAAVNIVADWEPERCRGDRGQGESGDLGEELGDLVTRRKDLDGLRDSERLRERTAEVTSTWSTCDGNARAPPALLE